MGGKRIPITLAEKKEIERLHSQGYYIMLRNIYNYKNQNPVD